MTAVEVCNFIRDLLAPGFPDEAYRILDNASKQQHASVHNTMDEYLNGPCTNIFEYMIIYINDYEYLNI